MHDHTFLIQQLQQLKQPEPSARLNEKIRLHIYLAMQRDRCLPVLYALPGKRRADA